MRRGLIVLVYMKHHKRYRDFRSLDNSTQAELRRLAFTHLDTGVSRVAAARIIQVNPQTVGVWCRKRSALESRDCYGEKRGRMLGDQQVISEKQQKNILNTIKEKTPDKANIPFALWTRAAIKALIKKEAHVSLRIETISKYTKRWGLTPQRPAKYAREQNPQAINDWLKKEYPAIVRRSKREKADIQWGDETGVSLTTIYARSYAPKGQTPTITLPARHQSYSMISSIANRGDLRFMLYRGALNSTRFIVFLKRLTSTARKKIFFINDNLKVHKSKRVMHWVKEHEKAIELFFPASLRTTIQS